MQLRSRVGPLGDFTLLHLTKAISCTHLSMANKLVCHGCSAHFWHKLEIQNRAPEQQWNRIAFVGRLFGNRRPNRTAFCWGCLVQRRLVVRVPGHPWSWRLRQAARQARRNPPKRAKRKHNRRPAAHRADETSRAPRRRASRGSSQTRDRRAPRCGCRRARAAAVATAHVEVRAAEKGTPNAVTAAAAVSRCAGGGGDRPNAGTAKNSELPVGAVVRGLRRVL